MTGVHLKLLIFLILVLSVFSGPAGAVPRRFQYSDKLRRFASPSGFHFHFIEADLRNTLTGELQNGVVLQTFDPMQIPRLLALGVWIAGEWQNDITIKYAARFLGGLAYLTGSLVNTFERNAYFLPVSPEELNQLLERDDDEWLRQAYQPLFSLRQQVKLRAGLLWGHTLRLRNPENLFESAPVAFEKIHLLGQPVPQTRAYTVEQVAVDVQSLEHPQVRRENLDLKEIKYRPNCRSLLKHLLQL